MPLRRFVSGVEGVGLDPDLPHSGLTPFFSEEPGVRSFAGIGRPKVSTGISINNGVHQTLQPTPVSADAVPIRRWPFGYPPHIGSTSCRARYPDILGAPGICSRIEEDWGRFGEVFRAHRGCNSITLSPMPPSPRLYRSRWRAQSPSRSAGPARLKSQATVSGPRAAAPRAPTRSCLSRAWTPKDAADSGTRNWSSCRPFPRSSRR